MSKPTHLEKKAVSDATHRPAKIEIDAEEYYRLLKDSITLRALRRSGVDNWEWYGDSFDDIYDQECIEKLPQSMLD